MINKSKTTGEPPLMNAMSVFFAIKNAIASIGNYNINPKLDAPATPEKILMSIKKLKKNMKNEFMKRAIELSIESVNTGGGPFGCVIVKDEKIISEGSNKVTSTNDPTAHGEIVAIREACKKLNNFNLNGFELYSTCEPCPMCLSAIYWARIDKIYYANTREDAQKIDFDDSLIYSEFKKNIDERKIPMIQMMRNEALKAFELWDKKTDKVKY